MIYWVIGAVAIMRMAELCWAKRNTGKLRARGALEIGRGHYPLFILLHAGWLTALAIWVPPGRMPDPWLMGLFALLLAARAWVIASLGEYWTTRIITLPGAPLVRRGPYRALRHPNYLVVAGEVAVLPLAFGAPVIALVFSVLNALLLGWRIRIEEQALAPRRQDHRSRKDEVRAT